MEMQETQEMQEIQKEMQEMRKEIRGLKRKLALAESNLTKLRHMSVTQDRVETVINNTIKKDFRFFQLVLENTSNILLLFDFDGRFAYASDTFLKGTGIANFGLINGRHYKEVLSSVLSEAEMSRLSGAFDAATSGKETVAIEESLNLMGKAGGGPRIYSIFITPMFDDNADGGNHHQVNAGTMIMLNDITDVKHLTTRHAEAESASAAKSAFLAKMSHEIRTPMNAIMGITEIHLQTGDISHETEEAFNKIYNSARILLNIINDLLDLSKIEAGAFDLSAGEYDVTHMLGETAQLNMVRIGSKPIEFIVNADENLPSVLFGDDLRIKQILNNLLSNAFKYTLAGEVELRVCAELREPEAGQAAQADLIITVRDTGQGMSPEQLDKLFEEYTRFNLEANRAVEGIGLGMSITHYLVNAMGGKITVESEQGKGTVFNVRLPQGIAGDTEAESVIGKERSEDLRRFRISKAYANKAEITPNKKMPGAKILSVDDMETNLYVIKGLLAVYDISADTAISGYEAIEKLEAGEEYDIIFMDHMMPYMNGVETTAKIRQAGYTMPIIALTANAVTGTREMFLENGFDGFLSKPVDMGELNAILEKWVPAEKQESPEDQEDQKPAEPALDNGTGTGIKIDGVDIATGILMTGGTTEGYLRILGIYYSDGREKIKQLESCLERSDLIMYTIHVHSVKGASASIGATALSESAENLEAAGKRRDMQYIHENHARFAEDLTELLDNISPLIEDEENHEFVDDADRILLGL